MCPWLALTSWGTYRRYADAAHSNKQEHVFHARVRPPAMTARSAAGHDSPLMRYQGFFLDEFAQQSFAPDTEEGVKWLGLLHQQGKLRG